MTAGIAVAAPRASIIGLNPRLIEAKLELADMPTPTCLKARIYLAIAITLIAKRKNYLGKLFFTSDLTMSTCFELILNYTTHLPTSWEQCTGPRMMLGRQCAQIRASQSPPEPKKPKMTTQPSHLTRRNSLAFFAALPVLDAVGNEARLWKQEAELYFRRSGEAINTSFGDFLPRRSPPSPSESSQIKLNAEFAVAMLAAISKAAGRSAVQLQLDGNKLAEKELPFFQEAGTCGHCGTKPGPSGLKDRDYFDFLTYTRLKALLRLARKEYEDGGGAIIDATAAVEKKLRDTIGDAILRHILSEVDVGEAAAVGISPFRASGSASVALLGASPELDSIRGGVKALLTYFENKGVCLFLFRRENFVVVRFINLFSSLLSFSSLRFCCSIRNFAVWHV